MGICTLGCSLDCPDSLLAGYSLTIRRREEQGWKRRETLSVPDTDGINRGSLFSFFL